MKKEEALLRYVLRLGDNALVLAQRLVELVAHGPELEEEMANANFALDYLGQARMFYSYAGELEGRGRSEDDFAFMRGEREFCNFLLVEQPNGHFGDVIARSVLFEHFYLAQLDALTRCSLWRFTGEMFAGDAVDDLVRSEFDGPDLTAIRERWTADLSALFEEATLTMPEDQWMDDGGRSGRHTEHFGPLIAEMQYMQRSYPGLNW